MYSTNITTAMVTNNRGQRRQSKKEKINCLEQNLNSLNRLNSLKYMFLCYFDKSCS